jgi:V/A-type H+-transporting ATPase subunit C
MSDAVADFPFGGAILSKRADVTNIKTVWRLLQYGNKYLAPALFKRAAVTGGTLSPSFFSPALEGTVTLPELLKSTPYGYFFGKTDVSAAHLEKLSDDAVMHEAKAAKQVAFGPEVPYAFVLALQTAVQNLRLLFAAKAAGLSSAEFRKRVRACYV